MWNSRLFRHSGFVIGHWVISTWLVALVWAQQHEKAPTAILAGGQRVAGQLAAIDSQWQIELRSGEETKKISAEELIRWGGYQDVERGPQVILADGSVIVGDVLDIGAKEITLGDATGLGRVLWSPSAIPRPAVRAIVYDAPADSRARDKLLSELLRSPSPVDELRLAGGEVIRGTLVAGDSQRLGPNPPAPPLEVFRIAVRGRSDPLSVSAAKVETLVLGSNRNIDPAAKVDDKSVTLGLRDGSLVRCRALRVGKSSLELELVGGGVLKAMLETGSEGSFWDQVTLVQPRSPRVKYLSDLETVGYKHIPFTAVEWPYGRDRSVTGGRLRSGGWLYLKGLGMHSASRLAYDLDGSWKRLEAEIALDDSAGAEGSVIFKVVLEEAPGRWQAAYESPVVRGGDPPLAISVELKKARRLALLVEYADRGDVLDHANWLNGRVVK